MIKDGIQWNTRVEEKALDLTVPFFEEMNPHTIFFVDKTDLECQTLEARFGYKFLNSNSYYDNKDVLFASFIFNITKKTKNVTNCLTSWSDLRPLKQPLNAIVIIDNYLLNGDESDLKSNIIPLLKILLPDERLEIPVHLSILTDTEKISETKVKNRLELLKKSFQYLDLEITIVHIASKDNHDRNIITNYLWLHSGHGFSYFNENGMIKKNTTLFYYPIWHLQRTTKTELEYDKTAFWSIQNLLENASETMGKTKDIGAIKYVWRNKENRLL